MDGRQRPIWIMDDPVNDGPEMAVVRADYLRELEAIVRELGECKRSVLNNERAVVPYWLVARAREVLK